MRIVRIPGMRYVRFGVMQDRRHTALRPLGGRVGQGTLRQDADPESGVLFGPLAAADKPATPLPTTSRSRGGTDGAAAAAIPVPPTGRRLCELLGLKATP